LKNMGEFRQVCYLFSPVLAGLILHGIVIRLGCFRFLCRPVDGGAEVRGRRLFGANKTWRGIVSMALGAALGFVIQAVWLHNYESVRQLELFEYSFLRAAVVGMLVGLATGLSELPNSFLKRQLDVAPGGTADGPVNALFYILDQVDFLVGTWIVLVFVVDFSWVRVLYSFIFLFVTHQVISVIGYFLGMRKTVR
jgi:hypothetical protein